MRRAARALCCAEPTRSEKQMAVRRVNHAVLYVKDLAASVDFYTDALGLEVRMHVPGRAAFLRAPGSANDHDLGLFEVAHGQIPRGAYIGLYHLAWEVGPLADLAETPARHGSRGAARSSARVTTRCRNRCTPRTRAASSSK